MHSPVNAILNRPKALEVADKQARVRGIVSAHIAANKPFTSDSGAGLPDPHQWVKSWIQDNVELRTGKRIDPDKVWLHQFFPAQTTSSQSTVTQYEHSGRPERSMTLTEAVTSDFFAAEQYGVSGKVQTAAHFASSNISPMTIFHSDSVSDFFSRLGRLIIDRTGPGYIYSKITEDVPAAKESWRDLDAAYGIYLDGPEAGVYNKDNELRLKPSQMLAMVRNADLQEQVSKSFDTFWLKHYTDWQGMAKAKFISEARLAREAYRSDPTQGLSENDYRLLMDMGAPNIGLDEEPTLTQLRTRAPYSGSSSLLRLDINGYNATDIYRFVRSNGEEIVYIPGEKPSLLKFLNLTELNQWVVAQGKDPIKAAALAQHFSLADRQQGIFGALSVNGVDSALKKLGTGEMAADLSHINANNQRVDDDLFAFMAKQTQARIAADIDTEIKSNAEVHKDDALGFVQSANAVFSIPLALLGPIGVGIGAVALGAQVGLEAEKAVDGDTQQERQGGFQAALFDVATMALVHAAGKSALPKAPGEPVTARQAPSLQRVNGQIGYLASPTKPFQFSTPRPVNPLYDHALDSYLAPGLVATPAFLTESNRPSRPDLSSESMAFSEPAVVPGSPVSSDAGDPMDASPASNATSSAQYSPYNDAHVLKENRFKDNVTLPAGGYFNSRGMIERTNIPKLYRAESTERVERRGSPVTYGFNDSNFFGGVEKMMEGDVLITSRSKEAAIEYGQTQFNGQYKLYEIDASQMPAVSLVENVEHNPQFFEAREGKEPGEIDELRRNGDLNMFGEGAYGFDEVHLAHDRALQGRITELWV
ncbi:dermonecrotic toxin domain-containing protein [Pseudomonas sp. W4I3]|uniref:dermonecrotic toxin domain-containing protein n=1 Tax=Pseudomonas sp. W4I3 TaxID=3042294 RepID=UPI00278AED08|nr:DUF6543 domain-containing protein [Pseudomonas sp. W4I3]MDQ0742338.1 hypothetical protein [Pseudomonas sp. W4I3]